MDASDIIGLVIVIFVGLSLVGLVIGLLTVTLMPVMCIFKFLWLTVLYTVLVVGLGVFAAVWCNTGKRFRK